MSGQTKASSSEREQTDESLRVERDKADEALGEAGVDEIADAVLSRARLRADEVLATARARTDRESALSAPGVARPTVERERVLEDRALQQERSGADEVLRLERAEHQAFLARERQETDKDLLSERARADHALATRDEFLGFVSHELRNLLNSMVLLARIIGKEVEVEGRAEQVPKHAQRIERAGARMDRLIGDLIDVASIEAGALAVVPELSDAAHVVAEAVQTFQSQAAAADIQLAVEVVPSPLPGAFDAARILQVLVNLLSNALKFTPSQGVVTVRAERLGDELKFAVSDTGEGIPPTKLDAVFERFVQVTKGDRRGVGLGLYISKCIVVGHGGRIWAESKVGHGSTICFTLPANAPC